MGSGGSKEEQEGLKVLVKNGRVRAINKPPNSDKRKSHLSEYADVSFGDGRFKMHCIIGRGGFGLVVAAEEVATSNLCVLKLERNNIFTYISELHIFHRLREEHSDAAPTFYSHWHELGYSVTQMEILGISLLDYVRQKKNFMITMTEACKLAPQMIDLIHKLHDIGILHCDIKPANFVFGLGSQSTTLKIIDFGLAMRWRNSHGEQHEFQYRAPKGTPAYMSVHQHLHFVNTRRDDLESMVYTLMDLCRIPMLWKSEHNLVHEGDHGVYWMMKWGGTDGRNICKNSRFRKAIQFCRKTRYDEEPHYEAFKAIFKENRLFASKKKIQPKYKDTIMNIPMQSTDQNILDLFRHRTFQEVPAVNITNHVAVVEELSDDEEIIPDI